MTSLPLIIIVFASLLLSSLDPLMELIHQKQITNVIRFVISFLTDSLMHLWLLLLRLHDWLSKVFSNKIYHTKISIKSPMI